MYTNIKRSRENSQKKCVFRRALKVAKQEDFLSEHIHNYTHASLATGEHLRTLGLDGVEGKLLIVQHLKGGVTQGGDGQGLKVKQLRGGRVLLGQQQVPERHGQLCLTSCWQKIQNRAEEMKIHSERKKLTY